jgi:hypothetical protein
VFFLPEFEAIGVEVVTPDGTDGVEAREVFT